MKANDIKPGVAVNIDGGLYVVTSAVHVKPGKGPAYIQAKVKSIASGAVTEKRFRAVEDVERAMLDKRSMQYLYTDASGAVFMDNESFEQTTIDEDLLGDALLYIKPNTDIEVMVYQEKPVSLALPGSVELAVKETSPQVKGATATNQLKEAVLETGLKTRVPPFIENGQVVRVNTEDGSYLGKA